MTVRFCTTCDTDVEVAEGHCLLGHSVRQLASMSPLDDLRTEVNQAFEEASFRVATILVEEGETPRGSVTAIEGPNSSVTAGGPPPPPPPPQPARPHRPSYEEMWATYDDDAEGSNDPMADFAPPPRMDWGPKRSLAFRRGASAVKA